VIARVDVDRTQKNPPRTQLFFGSGGDGAMLVRELIFFASESVLLIFFSLFFSWSGCWCCYPRFFSVCNCQRQAFLLLLCSVMIVTGERVELGQWLTILEGRGVTISHPRGSG